MRPGLSARYAGALPGARAAVLGRLWRGLLHDPLPGLTRTGPGTVTTAAGLLLKGPARRPYDLGDVPELHLGGQPWTHPAELLTALGVPGADRLVEDLGNCVASLALSRAGASPFEPKTPEEHEQSVVDGHPYHPGCRNRPGISVAEQLAYMPEHRPVVALDLVALPGRACLVAGPWPAALRDGDLLLLPVHPWQSRHVLPGLGLRPHALAAVPARPLMSVRTLAPTDGGPHLKTALSTRLTSSVRDISPGSVRDCVPLSGLLGDLAARAGGGLRVTRYLAGAAGPAADGAPSADLAVLLREPVTGNVLPVAAVTRPPDPEAWLRAFARTALTSLLRLLSLGAALEAHGQNLLVEPDAGGLPGRLVYRDLADVRLSPARLARHGVETPPVSPRLLSDDPGVLHAKLYGSLVGTTFGSLVALFGQGDRAAEARLWRVVATAAHEAFDALPAGPDARADRDALFAPALPAKAHLLARLDGSPPGDSWTTLPNPLRTW
ncbi:IucA/IucC family C-terminal-domain containing protein [Nonomuraea maritima]|uniref:IucA/IucC family C-terminal-domain containing protein n=1 Tax=Nonomuraea maritima TaxID=683260 RepID=UPI0037154AF5